MMLYSDYPVVILAGGFGTRIAEYSDFIPKPLVQIGNKPIISHIIDIYARQGFKSFIIAGGYKIEELKKYFAQYHLLNSDFKINSATAEIQIIQENQLTIDITVVDTGINTQTGGRLKRIQSLLDGKPFLVTYGDGVCNINCKNLIRAHYELDAHATITAVHPTSRYGKLEINNSGTITRFIEKPEFGEDWINGGFMFMENSVFQYLNNDDDVLELALLQRLAKKGKLGAYKHTGFWKSMDTLRDKRELDELAASKMLPWLEITQPTSKIEKD